jgi:hypothetical protein
MAGAHKDLTVASLLDDSILLDPVGAIQIPAGVSHLTVSELMAAYLATNSFSEAMRRKKASI